MMPGEGSSERPLRGARGWIITDDKVGMVVQCRGVADALGLDYVHKQVSPKGLARVLSPWLLPSRSERLGRKGSVLAAPYPDLAIATGRQSIPYIRALRRLAGSATFTLVLQNPRTGLGTADVIWVPEHDGLRGENVITTLTSPHSFSRARLAELRRALPAAIAALPAPRAAIVLGGPSSSHRFASADVRRLSGALAALAACSISFMITPSRRTPPALLTAVVEATHSRPRLVWDGQGANPYPHFLAHADLLVVTGDSVNMTGEACATGRPVLVFMPSGGSPKFLRFHSALTRYGATRPLPERLDCLPAWSYQPLDSACAIAAAVAERWRQQRESLRAPT
jgi:mitochondrial fission protein ELM1